MENFNVTKGTVCHIESKHKKNEAVNIKKVLVFAVSSDSKCLAVMPLSNFVPEHFANVLYIEEIEQYVTYGNIFTILTDSVYSVGAVVSTEVMRKIDNAVCDFLKFSVDAAEQPTVVHDDAPQSVDYEAIIKEKDETIEQLQNSFKIQEETYKKIISMISG